MFGVILEVRVANGKNKLVKWFLSWIKTIRLDEFS